MSGLSVIWFYRDLRVHDHAALKAACQAAERDGGQVLALYIHPEYAARFDSVPHPNEAMTQQALTDLRSALSQRGALLHLRQGDPLEVLSELHKRHGLTSLHTHLGLDQNPDLAAVEAWALRAGVRFEVFAQFGPEPSPLQTEPWKTEWERFMARPRHEAPDMIPSANVGIGTWPDLGPVESQASSGGRKVAIGLLRDFLGHTTTATSALRSSKEALDGLRPHIELGVVSLREVWQAAVGAHQHAIKAGLDIRAAAIAGFLDQLPILAGVTAHRKAPRRRQPRPNEQLSLGFGDPRH